jgi:hypothetical protein
MFGFSCPGLSKNFSWVGWFPSGVEPLPHGLAISLENRVDSAVVLLQSAFPFFKRNRRLLRKAVPRLASGLAFRPAFLICPPVRAIKPLPHVRSPGMGRARTKPIVVSSLSISEWNPISDPPEPGELSDAVNWTEPRYVPQNLLEALRIVERGAH